MWQITYPDGTDHRDTLTSAIEREMYLIALGYPKALVSVEWVDVGANVSEFTNYYVNSVFALDFVIGSPRII